MEPFAGSAAYACRYADRRVILCDADPVICAIWEYLINVSASEVLALPLRFEHIDELTNVPQAARWLIG